MRATAQQLELRARRKDHREALKAHKAACAEVERASEAKAAAPYGSPAYERESYNLNVALSQRRETGHAAEFANIELLRAKGDKDSLYFAEAYERSLRDRGVEVPN